MQNMNINIRRARHEDAEAIISVHVNSIRSICSSDYTDEQIEAWAGRKFKTSIWHQAMDRDFIWVLEHNQSVLGFGHFAVMNEEEGEVMGLYFVQPAIGKGLGKKMFDEFINIAREHGLKRIQLYSTITAKSFYESLGFRQSGGDTSIEMQGVAVPCYPMMRDLNERPVI